MEETQGVAAGWKVGLWCAVLMLLGGCATGRQASSSPRAPPDDSVERLTTDCEGGQAKSCGFLGALYLQGQGVAKDERRAAALFEKACRDGVSEACRGR